MTGGLVHLEQWGGQPLTISSVIATDTRHVAITARRLSRLFGSVVLAYRPVLMAGIRYKVLVPEIRVDSVTVPWLHWSTPVE